MLLRYLHSGGRCRFMACKEAADPCDVPVSDSLENFIRVYVL